MPEMYDGLARHYDLIYSWKDFKGEAEKVHDIIESSKRTKGKELLEIACGTGSHARHLKRWYTVTGLDKSRSMLAEAKKKLPKAKLIQGDMIDFRIEKRFDVITSLFSSIGYVRNYTNLKRAIRNFARHLKPGGVLVIEPFIAPSAYVPGTVHVNVHEERGQNICRMNTSKRRGNLAILDFHFLIGTKEGTRHVFDRHELGLFEPSKVLEILASAGLDAKYLKNGLMKDRGLFVAVKPQS